MRVIKLTLMIRSREECREVGCEHPRTGSLNRACGGDSVLPKKQIQSGPTGVL